jgi:hypothetical protein
MSSRLRKVFKSVSTPRRILPRRFISSSVVVCRKSNSLSLKCLMASGRVLREDMPLRCGFGSCLCRRQLWGADASRSAAVENRSDVFRSVGSPSMRVIMSLTMWGGNQHRAKMVLPLRIELRTSPFITLTLARPPRTAFVRWTIPSPWTLASH